MKWFQSVGVWFIFSEAPLGLSATKNFMRPGESKNTAIELFTNNVIHSYSQVGIKCQCTLQKNWYFWCKIFIIWRSTIFWYFLCKVCIWFTKKTDVSYAKFVYNHIQNVHTKYHIFLQSILVFSCLYLLSLALIVMWNETQ